MASQTSHDAWIVLDLVEIHRLHNYRRWWWRLLVLWIFSLVVDLSARQLMKMERSKDSYVGLLEFASLGFWAQSTLFIVLSLCALCVVVDNRFTRAWLAGCTLTIFSLVMYLAWEAVTMFVSTNIVQNLFAGFLLVLFLAIAYYFGRVAWLLLRSVLPHAWSRMGRCLNIIREAGISRNRAQSMRRAVFIGKNAWTLRWFLARIMHGLFLISLAIMLSIYFSTIYFREISDAFGHWAVLAFLITGCASEIMLKIESRERLLPVKDVDHIPDSGILLLRHNLDDNLVLSRGILFDWQGEHHTFEQMLCDQLEFKGHVYALLLNRNVRPDFVGRLRKKAKEEGSDNQKSNWLLKLFEQYMIRLLHLPLGAQRYEVKMGSDGRAEWLPFVLKSMQRCQLIVLLIGEADSEGQFVSPYLLEELRRVRECDLVFKTIFIMPPVRAAAARLRWLAFAKVFFEGTSIPSLPRADSILGVFFAFGKPVIVVAPRRKEVIYRAFLDLSASMISDVDQESLSHSLGVSVVRMTS